MKIVQVTHHFSPCIGGVESVVLELSKRLVKNGHKVQVVCLDRCARGREALKRRETIGGAEVVRLPFLDFKYYKIATAVLGQIKDADAVHVHGIGFFADFLLLTKWLHRKPVVVSTHGGIMHTKSIGTLKKIYTKLWMPRVLSRADAVVAVSRNDMEEFSRVCGREKLKLIENGIDYARFADAGAKVKRKKNSFIYVGRLSRNKRVDNLIETFACLKKAGTEFTLTILGNDFDGIEAQLRELAKELGVGDEVVFVSSAEGAELARAVACAEYFVSASEYEGFGLSTVEAMAAGTIPLVNGIPAFRQIIHNEKDGFLLDYSKPEIAAQGIAGAIAMPDGARKKISIAAIERAKEFDWGKKIGEFERIYTALVQK